MSLSSAFGVLGLSPEATVDAVKARWRELARQHHPDKGGDAETFHKFRQAYMTALQAAIKASKRRGDCSDCAGTGKVVNPLMSRSFHVVRIRCKTCGGRGRRDD